VKAIEANNYVKLISYKYKYILYMNLFKGNSVQVFVCGEEDGTIHYGTNIMFHIVCVSDKDPLSILFVRN
jgi:hypothetical protein